MPIYEYACKKCKHEFEVISFSSNSDDEVTCPACGEKGAEKLMSAFAKPGCSGSCSTCSSSGCST